MTLTETIETFKTKLSPSKIMNSLGKAASFKDESDNGSGENNPAEDVKSNPYINSADGSVKSSGKTRITRNER